MLDRTTGTRTPEAVEADDSALEAATWRVAVAEVSMVLPAELVVVMPTTVGSMELAAELSADEAAVELSEEAADDSTTDELRPDETAAREDEREDAAEETSEGEVEDCAAEEDAAAEESGLCWEETELWAVEDEARVEEIRLESEEVTTTVSERDAGEAEIDEEAEEADEESALLSPPVVLEGAADDSVAEVGVETAEVSVVRETEVVLESVTTTASVLVVDDWSEEVVGGTAMTVVLLPLSSCLLRSSARTATSCFAISMRREASDGLSFWMCSRALWSFSNTPA